VNAGTTPVGSVLAGAVAERLGLMPTLMLAGAACAAAGLGLVTGLPGRPAVWSKEVARAQD
jgi:hypothetical protein